MTAPRTEELIEVACRLARGAGRGNPRDLAPLEGGRNNRVFRVGLDSGEVVLLKSYFSDARDLRDRRRAEWNFLDYAWRRGIRAVPEPIATDVEAGASLLSFVSGHKIAARDLAASHVLAAADFVLALNELPRDLASLAPASEACFSMAEHVATVDRRIARLANLDDGAPHVEEARALVEHRLRPLWSRVRARIETSSAASSHADRLAADAECASPSDFGFHNALATTDGRVTFLDFEYAGRDDPAKLVCDFFCQPEVPVDPGHYPRFVTTLRERLDLGSGFERRAAVLLDAYRIKWVCIMLNDFLPLGDARRAFALDVRRAARCRAQLDKAATALAAVTT